jgi:hypothetical protein
MFDPSAPSRELVGGHGSVTASLVVAVVKGPAVVVPVEDGEGLVLPGGQFAATAWAAP